MLAQVFSPHLFDSVLKKVIHRSFFIGLQMVNFAFSCAVVTTKNSLGEFMRGCVNKGSLVTASVLAAALFGAQGAQAATVVSSLDGSPWSSNEVSNGTVGIVDLSGEGGNLENNAPLGSGAVKLTTTTDNADKAEIVITGNLGTIGDFLSSGSVLYSFFKQSAGDLNAFAAAAVKIEVLDSSISTSGATDGYASFVYEPTWNQTTPGASEAVPTGDWFTTLVTGTSGVFWHTGIYGAIPLSGDGSDGNTLSDWNSVFSGDLASATILSIAIGVGSYNQGQTAFVDNVMIASGEVNGAYDFEAPAVPVPAALPLMLSGFGALGFVGWRKRRRTAA